MSEKQANSDKSAGVIVQVNVFQKDDPQHQRETPNGEKKPVGVTVRHIREKFGGDEFDMEDPFTQQKHRVALNLPLDVDIDATFVSISFFFVNEEKV